MPSRRRFQWIDNIEQDVLSIAAGAVLNTDQVSEAEIENLGGAMTLTRVVGSITPLSGATPTARFSLALFVFNTYVGAVPPTDWVNDTFQRSNLLGAWWWSSAGVASGAGIPRSFQIDLRTKRKLGQGVKIVLAVQNHGGATGTYTSHFRFLMQLP